MWTVKTIAKSTFLSLFSFHFVLMAIAWAKFMSEKKYTQQQHKPYTNREKRTKKERESERKKAHKELSLIAFTKKRMIYISDLYLPRNRTQLRCIYTGTESALRNRHRFAVLLCDADCVSLIPFCAVYHTIQIYV